MATVTFIKYAKQSAGALGGVAVYVAQANKTMQENGRQLVSGQNCTPPLAVREFSPPAPCTAKKVLSGFITMCSPSLQANRSPVSWHTSLQRCSRRGPGRRARCSSPPTSTASTSTRILLSIASASAAAKCFGKGRGRWQGCALSQMSFARRMDCLSFQDRKQRRKDLGQGSTAPPLKVRAGSSNS